MQKNIISVSIPSALIKQVDQLGQIEDRSRSSIMRRALLAYISARTPEEIVEADDLEAIKISGQEYALEQGLTLNQLKDVLEDNNSEERGKARNKVK
ncbi:MAG: ribbon-helix-helix protein, CopG family [Candidatus Paceibacterota bacterium]